jgi:hypothetical protein
LNFFNLSVSALDTLSAIEFTSLVSEFYPC